MQKLKSDDIYIELYLNAPIIEQLKYDYEKAKRENPELRAKEIDKTLLYPGWWQEKEKNEFYYMNYCYVISSKVFVNPKEIYETWDFIEVIKWLHHIKLIEYNG